ncbi:MAG: HD domain-containing protein [Peptococcaceae bacterium]|nr:HD domain-containing protein [Peptococcaceae bacterium]
MRIRELSPNQKFQGFLALRNVILKHGGGGPFLDLRLGDGETEAVGRVWGFDGQPPRSNTVLWVEGVVGLYNNQSQLILSSFRPARPEEYRPGTFLPRCPVDGTRLWERLRQLAGLVAEPRLSRLLALVFADPDLAERFRQAPGAVRHHHAYIGGLLHHTVNVTERALALAAGAVLETDMLVTGALLHDLGKMDEYSWDGVTLGVTDQGRFVGHIVLGMITVNRLAGSIPGLDGVFFDRLLHILASHHGKQEWGSPVEPCTREALLVHMADLADSRLFKMEEARLLAPAGENWSPPVPELGRVWAGEAAERG